MAAESEAGRGAGSEDIGLVAAPGTSGPRNGEPGAADPVGAGHAPDPGELVMGTPSAESTTTPSSGDGTCMAGGSAPASSTPLFNSGAASWAGSGRGALTRGLLALGNGLNRRLPSELALARVMVPVLVVTVLASLATTGAAKVFAGIWALGLVLSVIARTSAAPGGESLPVACSYWSALGLACAAPADAAVAVGAGLLVWTSARPGHEWLPWPMLYRRLARARITILEKLATTMVGVVPAAALAGVLLLWAIPSVGKGFAWFAGFGLASLLLLALTTAGEAVPATRVVGRLAVVLAVFGFASISDLRLALVGATAFLVVALFALEPRRSPSIGA